MKNLFSATYTEDTYNKSMLLLRMSMGITLAWHGYEKIPGFDNVENGSMNFLGLGTTISQILIIIVELVGGVLVALGLCTRLAAIAVIGWLGFVLVKSFGFDIFGKGEKVWLLLIGYFAILIAGAGKYSIDKIINNKSSTSKI